MENQKPNKETFLKDLGRLNMGELCEKYKSYFVHLVPMRCNEGDLIIEPTLNEGMPSRIVSVRREGVSRRIVVVVDVIT